MESIKNKYSDCIFYTPSWLDSKKDVIDDFYTCVQRDIAELEESDFVITFVPWGVGSKCETCYTLGLRKPILILADKLMLDSLKRVDYSDYSDLYPLALFKYVEEADDRIISSIIDDISNFRICVTDIKLFQKFLDELICYVRRKKEQTSI